MIARALAVAALAAMLATSAGAQRRHYTRTTDWGQLPAGKTWGEVTSVDIAPDGTVFVLSRCFAKDNNGCIGREHEPAVLKFDRNGKLLKAWGEGMFVFPHGAFLDKEGNYWTTDSRGNAADNDKLSLKRAQSVRDYLITQGIPTDKISAEGKGANNPVASNDTADGRAENRRVEIVVTPDKG